MRFFTAAAVLASAAFVAAQDNATFPCLTESEIDAKVPECAKACQQSALVADGCDYDDVGCHCQKTGFLGNLLIPCLANSTCTLDELNALDDTISPICEYFNGTLDGSIPKPSCSKPEGPKSTTTPAGETTKPTSTYTPPAYTPSSNPVQYNPGPNAASAAQIGSGLLAVVGAAAFALL